DRVGVHTEGQCGLVLGKGTSLPLPGRNEARIHSSEGIEKVEGLTQSIPIQMLHHGATQKPMTDSALHEIALNLAGTSGRPQPDVEPPLPVIKVLAAKGTYTTLVGTLKVRIIQKRVAVKANQRIVGIDVG